jgi:hypothetical protein
MRQQSLASQGPRYSKAGSGRRPVGLAIMPRVYFVQQWFNLSAPAVEETLYESAVLRRLDASIFPMTVCTQANVWEPRSPRTIELCEASTKAALFRCSFAVVAVRFC